MEINRRDSLIGGAAAIGAVAAADALSSTLGQPRSNAEAAESAPMYEIYALKYAGPMPGKMARMLWMEGWDKDIDRNYYVWVIKGKNEIIVVDTGSSPKLGCPAKAEGFREPG